VLDPLAPGDLVVDIGANMGSYTMLASKIRGARTIAVEPDPDTAPALRRNIEVNAIGDRVRVAEAALGAMEGTCPSPWGGTPSTASRARQTGRPGRSR
jgi:FkbM family methyltransferase